MPQPTPTSPRTVPSHAMLHNEHVNVKAFGATGDGITDDTAALQAAINAASPNLGLARVHVPSGNYKISGTLSLDTAQSAIITGSLGNDVDPSPGTWMKTGVRIFGSVNGPLIQKSDGFGGSAARIEDIGLNNTHATGTCIALAGVQSPTGVFRCNIRGHIGIDIGTNAHAPTIADCSFVKDGNLSGSFGIKMQDGAHIYNIDLTSYEVGILARTGGSFIGGRIENCNTGIQLGGGGFSGGGLWSSFSMEANDVGIYVNTGSALLLSNIGINGHSGSPSGGSLIGVNMDAVNNVTLLGVIESGTHLTNFIKTNGPVGHGPLTFINCQSTTAWSLFYKDQTEIINCTGVTNIRHLPVVATASLLAAGSDNDGQAVIENAGAGDRNLIIYAGGQRFRIDGGAAI